jgi:hypothetical protein
MQSHEGFIGFGRESTPGPETTVRKTYRVLTSMQEMCEICERIDERARMHYVGCDDDGAGLYVCDAAHPAQDA